MRLEIGARAAVCTRDPARNFSGQGRLFSSYLERERERGFRVSTYASGVDLVAESTRSYHDALNRDNEGWMFFPTKIGEIDFVFDQDGFLMGI